MKLILSLSSVLEASSFGKLAILDWEKREIVDQFTYQHRVFDRSNKGIAGCSWRGNRLLAVTEAEILEVDVNPLRLAESRTFRYLNDCHYAVAGPSGAWVCNTGNDCLEEFAPDWSLRKTHFLFQRFGRERRHLKHLAWLDYRKSWGRFRGTLYSYPHPTYRPFMRNVVKYFRPAHYRNSDADLRFYDFRPHALHPNHAALVGDDVWITLWNTGQLVSLKTGRVLLDDLGWPHDGLIDRDQFWVTDCMHNRVLGFRFDRATNTLGEKVVERVVTTRWHEGFVRGLAAMGDSLFVGLTVNRGYEVESDKFLRIRRLERKTLETLDEWVCPPELGQGVYSILPAEPPGT